MAASSFDTALKYVLIDEGGNDDDPQDHGGRTSRGITQREYDAWNKLNNKPTGDVWQASDADIKTIYHDQYWAPYCDDLPAGVDYVYFDTSVNAGRTQATRSFQKALGVDVDGMMGQITLSKIAGADPVQLIKDVSAVRTNFYENLAQFPRYGKGWLNRVNHCQGGALAMAEANTDYVKPPVDTLSAKSKNQDVASTTVQPETSGGAAVASGGLISALDNFKDSLTNYQDTLHWIKYILIGIVVISFSYSVYGFMQRSKAQAAM